MFSETSRIAVEILWYYIQEYVEQLPGAEQKACAVQHMLLSVTEARRPVFFDLVRNAEPYGEQLLDYINEYVLTD